MNTRLYISLLFSLFFFIVIVITNGLISMLVPWNFNFHHTHWIFGKLTGLWGLDFLVDIGITSIALGFIFVLIMNRYYTD